MHKPRTDADLNRRALLLGAGAAVVAAPALAAEVYTDQLAAAYGGPILPSDAKAQAWREIAALRRRAERLLKGLGAWTGDVARDIAAFMTVETWLYPDSAEGRARAAADMAARLAAARPLLAKAFVDDLPAPTFRSLTPDEEAAKRGGYRTADGYVVDLTAIRRRPAWTLGSVTFHETVPGHLLQAQRQAAIDPTRLKGATAYSEAWATYAEQLACELGVYRDDAKGELGYLHWRLFRMARIVVDVGLGAEGWSDAQGLQALADIQGAPIAFASFEQDVARMRQTPGAFAAQGLGALRFRQRRPHRGWAAWHEMVLREGPVPIAML